MGLPTWKQFWKRNNLNFQFQCGETPSSGELNKWVTVQFKETERAGRGSRLQNEKSEECEISPQRCQTGSTHSRRCRQSPPRWWTSGLPGWWMHWRVELQRAFSASGSHPGPPWAGSPDRMAVDQTVSPQLEYLVPSSKLPSRPLSGHIGRGLRLGMGKLNTYPTKKQTLGVFVPAGVNCVSPWLAPLSWSVPV